MNKLIIAAAAAAALAPTAQAAGKIKSIHQFCTQNDCGDGAAPWAAPVGDGHGNWYGATSLGGIKNDGSIYRMAYDGKHWKFTRIYSFCTDKKCSDGVNPRGALILDADGNLYGTASGGGAHGNGSVFALMPDGAKWRFKKLYDFCAAKDCTDGSQPLQVKLAYQGQASGAPYDGKAPLFGTTLAGGAGNQGAVFKLSPAKGAWSLKVLHDFCSAADCADGTAPYSGVTVDGSGNLFGAASAAATYLHGAIYGLKPHGKEYDFAVLHAFCKDGGNCLDGAQPIAAPIVDGQGNLYGTAFQGGSGLAAQGVVWKIEPDGTHSRYAKLHDFCGLDACSDGSNPWASLTLDADGHLFGTTYFGGDMNNGTVFKLTGTGLKAFTKVLSFGTAQAPGAAPLGGLVPDGSTYIGTTALGGGASGQGDFYRFTP